MLLARRPVPRILGEVSMIFSLLVFALFRMEAIGVNLAGILVASTALVGGIGPVAAADVASISGAGCRCNWTTPAASATGSRSTAWCGEVVSIRWRYTALATINNATIVIPNSQLMNTRVDAARAARRRALRWRRPIEFGVGYEWTPGQVLAVVKAALERVEIPGIATEPAAQCLCAGFDGTAIKYVVYYWVTDMRSYLVTDSRMRVHVYAALGRAGMEIPISRSELFLHSARNTQTWRLQQEQQSRVALLQALELFAPLTEDETHALAAQLVPTPFAPGDIATRQGEPSDSLYILARGQVGIFRDADEGMPPGRQRLAHLSAPAFFGEMGLLTGQARTATVAAESDALCYRLDKRGFEAIIRARPELAESMSQTVTERQAANDAKLASLSVEARARATGTRASELVRRIRSFFGLD